ncbi:MAG: oligosaccharide flippase family protein [Myxococcaceae bacterium]|nr:oligosaccharide flippase family protein [Myxococcaceae bacterium]
MGLLLVNALSKLAAFALLPLLTRTLSIDGFNQWVLAQTLFGALPLVMALGLPAAMSNRFFTHADPGRGDADVAAIGRMLERSAFAGLAVFGGVLGFVSFANDLPLSAAGALALSATGSTLLQLPTTHLRLRQRTHALAALQFADFASSLTCISAGLSLTHSVGGALVGQALAQSILGVFSVWYLRRALPCPSELRFESIRPVALPMVPHLIANQLQVVADRWCLGILAQPAELSRYAIASQLAAPVSMASGAWNETEAPRLGERYRVDGRRGLRTAFTAQPLGFLVVATVAAGLLLLGLPIVQWLLGKDFRTATVLLPAILAIAVFDSLYFPAVNVLFLTGQTRSIPLVTVSSALAGLLLNLSLVGAFGAWGAITARAAGAVARVMMLVAAARQAAKESTPPARLGRWT